MQLGLVTTAKLCAWARGPLQTAEVTETPRSAWHFPLPFAPAVEVLPRMNTAESICLYNLYYNVSC